MTSPVPHHEHVNHYRPGGMMSYPEASAFLEVLAVDSIACSPPAGPAWTPEISARVSDMLWLRHSLWMAEARDLSTSYLLHILQRGSVKESSKDV